MYINYWDFRIYMYYGYLVFLGGQQIGEYQEGLKNICIYILALKMVA